MFKIKLKQPKDHKDHKDGKDGKVEKPKIKLSLSKPQQRAFDKPKKVPRIRVKPTRIPGEGYDSEDSEIEDDPLLEEGIVVRLLPDAELDYVRHCVETGDYSNIHMKWRDKRRCIIKVNNSLYAAKLVQLPNIIEVQKTVDRKNMFKTIDISQILLVVKKIDSEDEINELQVGDNEVFDHGLTPPLHNVMKSETRRKTDTSYIHSLEAKVDELLRLDEEALDSTFELIDPENVRLEDNNTVVQTPMVPIVEDEEPAIDELELELEQALGEDGMEVDEPEQEEEEEEEEESDDDDDDESDNEQGVSRKVEVDENEQHNALLRDEIYELQQTIEQNKARLEKTHNPLLQSRFIESIKKLENELENKKRQLKTGEDKKKRDDAVKEAEEQNGAQVEEVEEEEEEEEEQEEEQRQEEEEDEGEEDEGDDDLDDLF